MTKHLYILLCFISLSVVAIASTDKKIYACETTSVYCDYSTITLPSSCWYRATAKDFTDTFFKYHQLDVAISYQRYIDDDSRDSAWMWRIIWNHGIYPISHDDVLPLVTPLLDYFYGIEYQPTYDSHSQEWFIEEHGDLTDDIKQVHIRRKQFSILMLVTETTPGNISIAKSIYESWTIK